MQVLVSETCYPMADLKIHLILNTQKTISANKDNN